VPKSPEKVPKSAATVVPSDRIWFHMTELTFWRCGSILGDYGWAVCLLCIHRSSYLRASGKNSDAIVWTVDPNFLVGSDISVILWLCSSINAPPSRLQCSVTPRAYGARSVAPANSGALSASPRARAPSSNCAR